MLKRKHEFDDFISDRYKSSKFLSSVDDLMLIIFSMIRIDCFKTFIETFKSLKQTCKRFNLLVKRIFDQKTAILILNSITYSQLEKYTLNFISHLDIHFDVVFKKIDVSKTFPKVLTLKPVLLKIQKYYSQYCEIETSYCSFSFDFFSFPRISYISPLQKTNVLFLKQDPEILKECVKKIKKDFPKSCVTYPLLVQIGDLEFLNQHLKKGILNFYTLVIYTANHKNLDMIKFMIEKYDIKSIPWRNIISSEFRDLVKSFDNQIILDFLNK